MPLAWPRAPAYVHTWRLSDLISLLLLLLTTGTAGHVAGDHHHHHHPARYGGLAAPAAPAALTAPAAPIALLNPWLSACDLAQPNAAPDLQGSCSAVMGHHGAHASARAAGTRVNGDIAEGPGPPGGPPLHIPGPQSDEACPRSCAVHNASHNQCLHYFRDSDKDRLCSTQSDARLARLSELRLRHCCEHSVAHSLTPEALKAVLSSSSQCSHYLSALLELDALAARLSCEFGEILTRYDCDHSYSVNFQCTHCQEAYRRWVCSSLLPHFPHPGGPRVRPCRAVCRSVEQKCPFFLPGDRAPAYPTQYAGEPTFLCLDPNIPESGEQLLKSSYGDDDCCYRHCNERGLPWLCPSQTSPSCLQGPAESSPPAVVCEPPPPAPTPAPGDRTLPSACAASVALLPPRLSSGSPGRAADCCLLGLIGVLILHQLITRVRVSSPARGTASLVVGGAGLADRPPASNRPPRPNPWPRPGRARLLTPYRPRRPSRPVRQTSVGTASHPPLLLQLLRRRVMLRTNRLGKRTTTIIIPPLFCFDEHVT